MNMVLNYPLFMMTAAFPRTIPTKARETKKMQLKAYLLHQLEVLLVINDKFKNLPSESYKSQAEGFVQAAMESDYVPRASRVPNPVCLPSPTIKMVGDAVTIPNTGLVDTIRQAAQLLRTFQ
ncbi:hypothetical protein IscW_ISCW023470 [Ixodes scapularis]|uniref:Uncharacterized protein n=1 Tax=Ixodes scapularis TaxID=6945 RepID=B7QLN7_IXOSC|nr:hypothetical protein IscW_ISCW023470 [Ixodes scapularis]|eukprot:XP_002416092.1 hypothetical protein IscW_ISCW023470 [Ixodes scapularis]